jgi:hypothetical protein
MSKELEDTQGLSLEELEQQGSEEVGEREEMSLINANVAAPVNAAVALNAVSDGSTAYANAEQNVELDQSN